MVRPVSTGLCALAALALAACGGSGDPGGGPSPLPDDQVVFLSDGRQAGVQELWASPLNGSAAPRVISGPLVAFADVGSFTWSPDRTLVAFVADRGTDGQSELYVVDVKQGTPVKVSGPLIANGDVFEDSVAWSSDSQRLAYIADANVVLKSEVFVTTPTGGAVRVSPASMDDNGTSLEVAWQPGGARLAFRADLDGDGDYAVSLVDPDGTDLVSVNGLGTQHSLHWSPTGARLALLTNPLATAQDRLYTILPGGGGFVEVSALASGGNPGGSTVSAYAWSADGAKLAFLSDRDVDGRTELWTVPAAGGTVVNASNVPAGSDVLDMAWSPGASLLAYRRTDTVTFLTELHVVFDSGIGDTLLADDDGVQSVVQYAWSPDGNRVAYTADHTLNNAVDLYVAGVLAPNPLDPQVSSGLLPFRAVHRFQWSPDSTRLLFAADRDIGSADDVFVGLVDGPVPTQVSQVVDATHGSIQEEWSGDGQRALWIAGESAGEPRSLFVCSPTGSGVTQVSAGAAFPALLAGVEALERR